MPTAARVPRPTPYICCFGQSSPSVTVRGRLVDAHGDPVAHADLRFRGGDSWDRTWTSSDGTFELATDSGGDPFEVDVVLPDEWFPDRSNARFPVGKARPGDSAVNLVLQHAQDVLAEGTLVDERGAPAAEWLVEAFATPAAAQPFASATTLADGSFRVLAWTRVPVTLMVTAPFGARRPVALSEGPGGLRLTADAPRVAGRVAVADGTSPRGAVVTLEPKDGRAPRSVEVDETGVFVFDDVADNDSCTLRAALSGFLFPLERCEVSGDLANVELRLVAPTQVVGGRILDSAGEPLPYVWVRLIPVGAGAPVQTCTEGDGSFRTTDASAREYDAFTLVTGGEGRLVPGPNLGRVRGGQTSLVLRTPR